MTVQAWQPPDEDASVESEDWHIRVRGIQKTFGPHHVLRGINLDIARGKINVVIGGSGQGKSVIMKHLMGLLKPDEGQIYVDGEDIVPLSDVGLNRVRKKFGMLFQYAALFDSMTVEENIVFPLIEHGDPDSDQSLDPHSGKPRAKRKFSRDELHKIAVEQLEKLALPQVLLGKTPAELSGGQRKRVGLARALVMKPRILLYDEPTTGLDPVSTKNVDDMMRDVSREHNVTSVIISHDMASTFRIGDRISALYEGVIIESGTPDEFKNTRHKWLREFISTSGAVTLADIDEKDLIVDDKPDEAANTPGVAKDKAKNTDGAKAKSADDAKAKNADDAKAKSADDAKAKAKVAEDTKAKSADDAKAKASGADDAKSRARDQDKNPRPKR